MVEGALIGTTELLIVPSRFRDGSGYVDGYCLGRISEEADASEHDLCHYRELASGCDAPNKQINLHVTTGRMFSAMRRATARQERRILRAWHQVGLGRAPCQWASYQPGSTERGFLCVKSVSDARRVQGARVCRCHVQRIASHWVAGVNLSPLAGRLRAADARAGGTPGYYPLECGPDVGSAISMFDSPDEGLISNEKAAD